MENKHVNNFNFINPYRQPAGKSPLAFIVIYEKPKDFPNSYVARLFFTEKATAYMAARDSMEELMPLIPEYMVKLPPDPKDDPNIKAIFV